MVVSWKFVEDPTAMVQHARGHSARNQPQYPLEVGQLNVNAMLKVRMVINPISDCLLLQKQVRPRRMDGNWISNKATTCVSIGRRGEWNKSVSTRSACMTSSRSPCAHGYHTSGGAMPSYNKPERWSAGKVCRTWALTSDFAGHCECEAPAMHIYIAKSKCTLLTQCLMIQTIPL